MSQPEIPIHGVKWRLSPAVPRRGGAGAGYDFDTADVEATQLPTEDHVVFEVIDGKHHLTAIWLDSEKVGRQVIEKDKGESQEKKKVKGTRKEHSSKAKD